MQDGWMEKARLQFCKGRETNGPVLEFEYMEGAEKVNTCLYKKLKNQEALYLFWRICCTSPVQCDQNQIMKFLGIFFWKNTISKLMV